MEKEKLKDVLFARAQNYGVGNQYRKNKYYKLKLRRLYCMETREPLKGWGKDGYEFLENNTGISKCATLPEYAFDPKYYNIQQYCNTDYVDKFIEDVTVWDKIGAYVSWLNKPLPVGEPRYVNACYEPKDDEVLLYIRAINKMATFVRPKMQISGIYKVLCYKLEKVTTDEQYERMQELLRKDKAYYKKLFVAGIGYMKHKRIATQYIWYMQGKEILDLQLQCRAFGGIVLKVHTDSIAFIGMSDTNFEEYKKKLLSKGYKQEHADASMYMINAATYHIKGTAPKGYVNPHGFEAVLYADGEVIPYSHFPCLVKGKTVISGENAKEFKLGGKHGFFKE